MFELKQTSIPGCVEIIPPQPTDLRGRFVKVLHRDQFSALGLETDFPEQYFTVSRKNVLRGMHFQLPPHDHSKLVYCVSGEVLDVVLDLRRGSPSFGKAMSVRLTSDPTNLLYLPRGLAHGFLTLSAEATMVYHVGSVHAPTHDSGVRWDSFGFDWPAGSRIISDRDLNLPSFTEFASPFEFGKG